MDNRELLDALLATDKVEKIKIALASAKRRQDISEVPFGGRDNNIGPINVSTDPARSIIERVTNAIDALLEYQCAEHNGVPNCRSPREAANAWLGVPESGGLSGMSGKERQALAANVVIRVEPGEGSQSRTLTVIDKGCGIAPEMMSDTILSLNASNKIQKHYLAGTYGQGGSSTFGFSKFTLIATRLRGAPEIAFTVVRFEELPAETYKNGHYVYLVSKSEVLRAKATSDDIDGGTLIKHFGYELANYTGAIGPDSLYGAFQRMLFDPVCAVRLEDWASRKTRTNRTIKGARNALNGAVDQDDENSRGPELDHNMPLLSLGLGDIGNIEIEYWVLNPGDGTKNPANAFVSSNKPIVLTHNGQNQSELSALLIKKDADLPYLRNRLIVHVNCDHLSSASKRALFSSTREQAREGFVLDKIRSDLVDLLKSDDELKRLNEEAREHSLKNQDEAAEKRMQRQLAKLLRLVGPATAEVTGGKSSSSTGNNAKGGGGGGSTKLEPIPTTDPPTFIRLVSDASDHYKMHADQRRYIKIETDANSDYADRINFAVGADLEIYARTRLRGGRMRLGVQCKQEVSLGSKSCIRVELYRPGLSVLSDECDYVIVEPPTPKGGDKKTQFPLVKMQAVNGPTDKGWDNVCNFSGDTDVSRHASGFDLNDNVLYVYYSTQFPRFVSERRRLEKDNPAFGSSFQKRYELWIAVHALLLHADQQDLDANDDDNRDDLMRMERCRLAAIASMIAAQEVKSGVTLSQDDEEAA